MLNKIILACFFAILATSCVQKAYKKNVVLILDTRGIKDIHSVGIRGVDKPLSWDYDQQMLAIKKDTTYRATVTFFTGYKFTKVKFVVNGQFELEGQPNRRINFANEGITTYRASFNNLK